MKKALLLGFLFLTLTFIQAQVTANQPSPIELCDENNPGDEIEAFDLTTRESEIVGAQIGLDVTWHETQADATAGINAIANPTSYININNPQTIFARVTDPGNGDFDTTTLTLLVYPLPSPVTPTPLEVCDDDNDGFYPGFILTDKDAEIVNGELGVSVSYHETLLDATNGLNSILSPYSNVVPFVQTVYARVENNTLGCYRIVELLLIVNVTPIPGQPHNIYIYEGDGNGMAIFDLTVNDEAIAAGTTGGTVSYFETENDALININAIANPIAYANTSNPQTIYANLISSNECYSTTQFIIATDSLTLLDSDDDSVPDVIEDVNANGNLNDDDTDSDTIPNYLDNDDDGDTTLTIDEDYNNNGSPTDDDINNNNIPDFLDPDVNLSVNENVLEGLRIYPNPTLGIITLSGFTFTSEISLTLYSLQGKKILSEVVMPKTGTLSLDLSNLNSGVYFLKITSEGVSTVKKIIKNQ